MNQYVICSMNGHLFSFLMENEKPVEIHCEEQTEEPQLDDIYVGRVKDIAKNIGAAFLEIAPDTVCYLDLNQVINPIYTKKGGSKSIQQGDELLVQVNREAIKSKYPSVTTNLTLHAKTILLTREKNQINASSKLEKKKKEELITLVKKIEKDHGWNPDNSNREFGWLIRTNAGETSESTLCKDMERLYTQYQNLINTAIYRPCFTKVAGRPRSAIARLSDLYDSTVDQYLTDDQAIFEEMKEYLIDTQPNDLSKLSFYEDSLQPLSKRYSLEKELEKALSDTVRLDCGGYLIVEPTETMTVIDVNSGNFDSGKDRRKTALKVNLEAAAESSRQIRLRNLSGIILIDFINMDNPEDNDILLKSLEKLLKNDPIKTVLVDMTKLSLVEITRQKKEKPLHEILKKTFDSDDPL